MSQCPKCNSDLIYEIKGSSYVISCTNCDWGLATSYIEPIFEDETKYRVTLEKGNLSSKENIRTIAHVMNCNFLQAKKVIESDNQIIVEGCASEIIKQVRKLRESNVKYSISPNFSYE